MDGSSTLPTTRYARSGNVHVAYQIFGKGEIDLVFFPGFVSNIETYWEEPNFAHWLNKLASFARVITFDKRGTGLSDRVESLPTMDERMDDVRAVMDAAGSRKRLCSAYRRVVRLRHYLPRIIPSGAAR